MVTPRAPDVTGGIILWPTVFIWQHRSNDFTTESGGLKSGSPLLHSRLEVTPPLGGHGRVDEVRQRFGVVVAAKAYTPLVDQPHLRF